ncbi:Monensin polyketide synthase acyl carrier protein [Streptomyces lydicus]|nr:Monensin polyketide synthase acyl carrier protein [Streptomyces lydicus]
MREFTLAELQEIMAAGGGDDVEWDGDVADTEFTALGYDSLAVLELCGQLERRYGISVPDDAVPELPTPAKTVEYVNMLLAKARV